ncbi:hypothetical protein IW261DRAFT_1572059 [Armillaria novae-zelandiae]|uniref:DUF6534 domain-containing protein n=1 Tax=Armillaria novae-zelandiae TaxID=153914 RepID=A0AA39NT38_9AGAR|nr:hypothetical protein IW261DRAFT_1576321 [Armillaria novae-zelandiae]KAK0471367.1 hypothetical protein IW261DRAFT_1572059 [Armillaria novae-zelandiae]
MALTAEEHSEAVFLLGPWLIGCYLEIFLQGILCCQFSHYWSWYRDDKWALKWAVGGLVLLTTLKSIQSFALIWIQSILYVNDLADAINLNYTAWWQSFNSLFVASIGIYVQAYFCYRLYVISKGPWVVTPIAILCVYAYISMILACYYITKVDEAAIGKWFASHLGSVFAADFTMTFATAYFLIRSKKNVLPQTVGLITALVRLTFQTAAPASICAMLNLIFSQIYSGQDKLVSTAFNQILPKLYAISMMWTLNARRNIRLASSRGTSSHELSSYNRSRRRTDMELGGFTGAGIQVRTVQETIKHIDLEDSGRMKDGSDLRTNRVTGSDDYSDSYDKV